MKQCEDVTSDGACDCDEHDLQDYMNIMEKSLRQMKPELWKYEEYNNNNSYYYYVNSYQRTQMNLRGLSCWMLPSPPVSRLGHSRLAKVDSQVLVPGGVSISLSVLHLWRLPGDQFTLSFDPEPTTRRWICWSRASARCAPRRGARTAAYAGGAAASDSLKNGQL